MADKKEAKLVLERNYNIPLRKEWLKAPKYKRTKKAVLATKQFLSKHMKSENVFLNTDLNEHLWAHGIKNPPHHVAVIARKDDTGKVVASLSQQPKYKETLVVKRSRLAQDKKAKALERKAQLEKKKADEAKKKDDVKPAAPIVDAVTSPKVEKKETVTQ